MCCCKAKVTERKLNETRDDGAAVDGDSPSSVLIYFSLIVLLSWTEDVWCTDDVLYLLNLIILVLLLPLLIENTKD